MAVLDRFRLTGRAAVVTGGASGIGESFAFALAEAGSNVAVADRNGGRARHVAERLAALGVESMSLEVDVTSKEQVRVMVAEVADRWGHVDIGVNNAGIALKAQAEEMTEADWDATIAVDLKGVFLCTQAEGRLMLEQGAGSIINTASMSGRIVNRPQLHVAYNAAKAGVVQLTRNCAAEWGSRGVRVNCISPGHTLTPMTALNMDGSDGEIWKSNTPMDRLGLARDLQGGLVYLASDASSYVTGHNLTIDGGYTLW